ncbi:MAG: hypothetical protein R6X11_04335, partial [Desulfonatronovibrio sp.]
PGRDPFFVTALRRNTKMASLLSALCVSSDSWSGRETKYLTLWLKRAFCMVLALFWLRTLEPEEP